MVPYSDLLLYFGAFAAMGALCASTIAVAVLAACSFVRSMIGLPAALRELRQPRPRKPTLAELNQHKRAGV